MPTTHSRVLQVLSNSDLMQRNTIDLAKVSTVNARLESVDEIVCHLMAKGRKRQLRFVCSRTLCRWQSLAQRILRHRPPHPDCCRPLSYSRALRQDSSHCRHARLLARCKWPAVGLGNNFPLGRSDLQSHTSRYQAPRRCRSKRHATTLTVSGRDSRIERSSTRKPKCRTFLCWE